MGQKKYFMILDTETCGEYVFDYGYTVIDRKGNLVAEGSFVCEEFVNHPEVLDMFHDRFTKTKIAQYYFSLYRGMDDFTVMPFAEIRNTINTVGDVAYMDIWAMALSVLCNSRNYLRFCKEHDLTTAKGHPQTGAEAVYRYLTNDACFEEKHTARADCEIESYIFAAIMRRKRKFDSDFVKICLHNAHWREISRRFAAM